MASVFCHLLAYPLQRFPMSAIAELLVNGLPLGSNVINRQIFGLDDYLFVVTWCVEVIQHFRNSFV